MQYLVPALDSGGGGGFSPLSLPTLRQFALDGRTPYYSLSKVDGLEVLNPLESYGTLRSPRKGRVWQFDGVNDYGVVPAAVYPNIRTTMTISMWFNAASLAANSRLICFGGNILNFQFTATGKLFCGSYNGSIVIGATTTTTFTTGGWFHVAYTFDPSGGVVYVNGIQEATHIAVIPLTNNSINRIGSDNSGTSCFGGSLRDIRFFSTAKTAAEILAIKNGADDSVGLLAHYPCNEEGGTTGYDISGNANHLTLTNITTATFHATDAAISRNRNNEVGYREGRNLLRYSEQFDNAAWTKQSGVTVTPNQALSPIGDMTADLITGAGTTGVIQTVIANGTLTRSVWLRAVSGALSVVLKDANITGITITANLTTDWQRFSWVENNGSGAQSIWIDDIPAGGIYAWGAQIESGTTLTDYMKTEGTAHTPGVIIPKRLGSDLAADGNALTETGKSPYPIVVETPCITFDGVSAYADLGSPFIPTSGDFELEILASFPADPAGYAGVLSQSQQFDVSSGFYIATTGVSTWKVSFGVLNNGIVITPPTDTLCRIRTRKVGTTFYVSINDEAETSVLCPSSVLSANTFLAHLDGGTNSASRVADLRITVDGITTYFPLQEGAGRDVHWYKSDGTYGVIPNAIVNGTLANIWANRVPSQVQDHCVNHGGRIGAGGEFILGVPGTNLCADGNTKSISAGNLGNPFSRANFNPFTAAELNGLGLETAYAPGTARQSVAPVDTKFRRLGDDRFIALSAPATGTDKTKLEEYCS